MLNNDFINAGIITINIVINIPINIMVIRDLLPVVDINESIKIFESFWVIAVCNADAPSQLPKTAFNNIIENVSRF